ncbi:hypothetical protein [Spirosoma jeollabukense]
MQEFVTAKKFNNEEPFQELVRILEKNSIPFQTETYGERIDSVTIAPIAPEYIVKVPSDKYAQVHEILNELAAEQMSDVDRGHYLFDFSDQELYDILAKPDEWSAFDYQLAQKILQERGKQIDKAFLASLRKARIETIAKPEEEHRGTIWIGYLSALLGGVIGIAIGWNMVSSRKTLPTGEQVYTYQKSDRKHGVRILLLGIVMFIVTIYLRVLRD